MSYLYQPKDWGSFGANTGHLLEFQQTNKKKTLEMMEEMNIQQAGE
jgi:hypothetical protein